MANERSCHSIVKLEVHFDVVAVGKRDKDWENGVAQFLSDVLVVGCLHIKSAHWLLFASR